MFIDYLPMLLVNMAAGLLILAAYFWRGLGRPDPRIWAPAFAMVGLVAFVAGLHLTFTWPLPKLEKVNLSWANVAWGEMSVLLGTLYLGAALAIAKEWSLVPVAVYGLVASVAALVVGIRLMDLGLSSTPALTGTGFLLTAFGGILALPSVAWPAFRLPRILAGLSLVAAAGIWAFIGLGGYWMHLERFSK